MTHVRVVAFLAAVVGLGVALAGLTGGGRAPRLVPRTVVAGDPLAFSQKKSKAFEQAAAEGLSQVIYLKSPGGVVAAAARTAAYRPLIDAATKGTGIDPDVVEGIVMLESGGLPNAIAGSDPVNAAGLTQILAGTAVDFLGMHVDLAGSRRLTDAIAAAEARGDLRTVARLEAKRRQIDDRFDPPKAIAGTVRYLTTARTTFGTSDFPVVSYHMGIGNLENVLRDFAGAAAGEPIQSVVEQGGLTWGEVFFDSSPVSHAAAWERLVGFGDDSKTYYWRVLAAEQIMRLYRRDPVQLEALASLHTSFASADAVLHPEAQTPRFLSTADLVHALSAGVLQPLPDDPAALHFRIGPDLGGLADQANRSLYRALRSEALSLLLYLAGQVHALSGSATPLTVTSAVTDQSYEQLLPGGGEGYSLATTGFAFDLLRSYGSFAEARALQYELDRLQALDLVAWTADGAVIHVTVSTAARRLIPATLRLES